MKRLIEDWLLMCIYCLVAPTIPKLLALHLKLLRFGLQVFRFLAQNVANRLFLRAIFALLNSTQLRLSSFIRYTCTLLRVWQILH